MTLTNLEKAEHEGVVLEAELSMVETAIAAHDTARIDESDCDIFLNRVKIQLDTLNDIFKRVLNCKPADTSPYATQYASRSKRICKAQSFLQTLKKTYNPSSSSSSQPKCVKLPKMDLKKFHGTYEDWPSFQDMFTNQVGTQPISDAEKLSYLLSCVEGDAKQLIKSFTITDSHYKEAWDVLKKRYDNKKEIVNALIRRLLGQPVMKTENVTHLQQLQNTTNECLRSLKVLGRETDKWDDLIVVSISNKLDSETRAEWAKFHRSTDPPTYEELDNFLTLQVRSLQARGPTAVGNNSHQRAASSSTKQVSANHASTTQQCVVCAGTHPIFNCEKFKTMNASERCAMVKEKSLCYNCLKSGHSVRDCKSTHKCKKCNKTHNTLIHRDQQSATPSVTTAASTTSAVAAQPSFNEDNNHVMVKTVQLVVNDSSGNRHTCRAVLDECSQSSFITESCASALGMKRNSANVIVNGISATSVTRVKHQVQFMAQSRINQESVFVKAYVMKKIMPDLQKVNYDYKKWTHIKDLQLADPDYYKPGRIDILLGAEVVADIIHGTRRGASRKTPTAQDTIFGHVLFGEVQLAPAKQITSLHASCEINSSLQRFWELEKMPKMKHLTKDESICENHFANTHHRDDSGRYVCRLPFNDKKKQLGDSYQQALSRFNQLEKRLNRQPAVKEEYMIFMREYLELNHMELVPDNERDNSSCYYLPHHCVQKEDSTTTKLRVVFDGSAKTTTNISLNDALQVGPVVQDDLFTILLRFRMKPIALKADIAKMYRQFVLPKEDADYLRILWREKESEPIKIYRLTTVTYGTASAPFQATRCLQQLASDESTKFPAAAEALSSSTYVDDLLSCADSTEEAVKLYHELNGITATAGMCIRKWATNSQKVLDVIDPCLREKESISFDTDNTIKALGIRWNPADDAFRFQVKTSTPVTVTKRVILSELAKVFDPLGWLSPVTINAKIILQELWKSKSDWDESPSESSVIKWNEYQQSLSSLTEVRIRRCIISSKKKEIQLHAFSDASSVAYSGAVYLRVEYEDGGTTSNLVAAKTRVAPIQQQSIPRLELCGAELASELVQNVNDSMKLTCKMYGWTDSTIVLHWLASFPGRWKTFIANRVSKIQEILPFENWKHVVSEENPADCASRGINACDLLNNSLWWHGPEWLMQKLDQSHSSVPESPVISSADLEEKKITTLITTTNTFMNEFIQRYSSLVTLQRVYAYVRRFLHNCRSKTKLTGFLTVKEIYNAINQLVANVQHHHKMRFSI